MSAVKSQMKIEELKLEIQDLEKSKRKSEEISNNLNMKLSNAQSKFNKEKSAMSKEH